MSEVQQYRVRIDEVDGFDIKQFITIASATTYVVVHHQLPRGNLHYHAFIETTIKNANLRKKLRSNFPMLEKTDYSIKKCDADRINEYVQYMFNTKHGNQWRLVDKSNFDDTVLNSLVEAAQKISDDFGHRQQQRKANKGPTVYDLATEVNEAYNKSYLAEHSSKEQYYRMLELSITICHKHRKAFEENLLRRIVSTAITIGSDQGRHTIITKIMQKEFRDIVI